MPRKVASVFSNIGVGEAYLADAGFNVTTACELDVRRCDIYRAIYPNTRMVEGDITDPAVRRSFLDAADGCSLLIATPPCQGFSTLGQKFGHKLRDGYYERHEKQDPRNDLVADSFRLANELRPPYFLLENVPRMATVFRDREAQEFASELLPGYAFKFGVMDAADHGTPQSRRRAIFLCSRSDLPPWEMPPKSEHRTTLAEAIGHLPSLEAEERCEYLKWHFAGKHASNHVKWMRHTPTGRSAFGNQVEFPSVEENGEKRRIRGFDNTYKRMEWDVPAPTLIQGSHMVSSSNTVHPGRPIGDGLYSDARTLTVLEAMLVMGLPNDWPLPNLPYREAIMALGEGFCPRLVEALVRVIPSQNA